MADRQTLITIKLIQLIVTNMFPTKLVELIIASTIYIIVLRMIMTFRR